MFDRTSERTRVALFFARYESAQLGSHAITPEHLLLGVLRQNRHSTDRLFNYEQHSIERLRTHIVERSPVKQGPAAVVEAPFTDEAHRVLAVAAAEADALGHAEIGRVHLLLGLLRESDLAATWLNEHDWTLETVRATLAKTARIDSLLD